MVAPFVERVESGPNDGSRRSSSTSLAKSPRAFHGMTIRTGSAAPPRKLRSRAVRPRFDSYVVGNVLTDAKPVFRSRRGEAARRSSATEAVSHRTGRRITARAMRDQKRLSAPAVAVARPSSGTRSESTRSPSSEITAGTSVSAATTETIPTRIAPAARLRMMLSGTSSIPTSAITNAVPLKRTARLAVPPAAAIASIFSRPRARSSRKRESTNSE